MPDQALITGASSGIGRALALEFARHGYRLLLTGRDQSALDQAAAECAQLGSPQVATQACDLANPSSIPLLLNRAQSEGLELDTLINNAGIGVHGPFATSDLAQELAMVRVQIDATLTLTKALLPSLLARKRAAILNVSSVYAFSPVPHQSIYGACKAFLLSFSESLAYELRGTGVRITVLCPGSTRSQLRQRAGVHREVSGMQAEEVARQAFRALKKGRFLAVPGSHNALFARIMRHLPLGLRARAMAQINRKRGLDT